MVIFDAAAIQPWAQLSNAAGRDLQTWLKLQYVAESFDDNNVVIRKIGGHKSRCACTGDEETASPYTCTLRVAGTTDKHGKSFSWVGMQRG